MNQYISSMADFQIRPIRESELDELIGLLCLVHNAQGAERYRGYIEGDPTWQPEQTPVVICDKRIVSTLRIWDRQIHLGATPVRIGGIGGVTTHPEYRRRGLATGLMAHAEQVMRSGGYDIGLLFTEIPAHFYARLGWHSVPMAGFRATWHGEKSMQAQGCLPDSLAVESFEESRDLEEAVVLYQQCNGGRSGTMLRPRPYWDFTPSRVRGVLPTTVVRSDRLHGYLSWDVRSDWMRIGDIAADRASGTVALVQHLLAECSRSGVTQVYGDIPHTHPFVDALLQATGADLELAGNASMMALPLDLSMLIEKTVPTASSFAQRIPVDLLLRLLFGESSLQDLLPVLASRGIEVEYQETDLLQELFRRRDPVFWAPDHF
ncbi:MAG: GNAT family N-acetyltransferase [Gemmatimonadetes bacterium]|nr:GNAT family N-acetyltransferase [Gemmatimonadota bacterium]MBT5057863.1 GNAT family N-acetyltransferase [Gemmatimonadota bacterium]MBT5144697.1 GNAT family N-acetyltransferase [Gemmatimonadota bacterium]MBT5587341.1 GNAT family N-acetyltransferase [Gemmatimonadota bacterium]MBT5963308.1 GNAT family N-acetyltransferase [Gemmatimonadota bacterium]